MLNLNQYPSAKEEIPLNTSTNTNHSGTSECHAPLPPSRTKMRETSKRVFSNADLNVESNAPKKPRIITKSQVCAPTNSITNYSNIGAIDEALQCLRNKIKLNLPITQIDFGLILRGCCQSQQLKKADEVLEFMKECHIEPNGIIHSILLNIRCKQRDIAGAKYHYLAAHKPTSPNDHVDDRYLLSPLLTLYEKLNDLDSMQDILSKMKMQNIQITSHTASYLLKKCVFKHHPEIAHKILRLTADTLPEKETFERHFAQYLSLRKSLPSSASSPEKPVQSSIAASHVSRLALVTVRLKATDWIVMPIPARTLDESICYGAAFKMLPTQFVAENLRHYHNSWKPVARQGIEAVIKRAAKDPTFEPLKKILSNTQVLRRELNVDEKRFHTRIFKYEETTKEFTCIHQMYSENDQILNLYLTMSLEQEHYDLLLPLSATKAPTAKRSQTSLQRVSTHMKEPAKDFLAAPNKIDLARCKQKEPIETDRVHFDEADLLDFDIDLNAALPSPNEALELEFEIDLNAGGDDLQNLL
jgi:pentatricopeptide repeat protein